ncbi:MULTISPECIES: SRPBCC family protein [Flammeovirga]|uniref:Polyketide cyclase / dehydrase and lipid transport n=1 Tax=Flammeovirga agarivorans TaxID=2726742 RepID=A0A7X8SHL5_9BACT|nr:MULTISPECIES: hypothetical protein [Flammeovirga]NLR90403.1 hypothetical protein [Flammeovirga agarivorans]
MNVIRSFSLGVFSILVLFFGVGLFLPSHYEVNEQVLIQSKPSKIFFYIDNLQKWEKWAFKLEDPESRVDPQFLGPEEGEGAVHSWFGNDGSKAQLKILSSNPYDEIQLQMITNDGAFISDIVFTLEGGDQGTLVTWNEKGDFGFNPMVRLVAYMSDYNKKIATQYQVALEELKLVVESSKTTSIQ